MDEFNAGRVLAEAYTLYKKHHDGMGLDFKIAIAQIRKEAKAEALQDLADNHTVRIPDVLGYKVQAVFTETIWDKLDDLEHKVSKCISSQGEYSEHKGTGEYCDWCGDCNHEAIRRNAKIEALRDVAESNDLIGHMYCEYDDHPLQSTLAPANVRATSNYLHSQANLMEGDE